MAQAISNEAMRLLEEKAEAVHIAALNLGNTLGIFHGINDALEDGSMIGPEAKAINVIQFDMLQLLLVRVCALCDSAQNRPDDASIAALMNALRDRNVCDFLINADKRWRAGIGPRAQMCADVQKSISGLRRRWSAISSQPEVLKRLYHFRNKRLGHVTIDSGLDRNAQLNELWKTARNALSAARQVRLVFHREDFNYLVVREQVTKPLIGSLFFGCGGI